MMLLRRKIWSVLLGGSKRHVLLLPLLAWALLVLRLSWMLARQTSSALAPPPPPAHDLTHFRRNRSLKHYMDNIQLLIEPSSTACQNLEAVPVVVIVASAPTRYEHRHAIRQTWAKYQPTFFLMGLDGEHTTDDQQLIENYVEAKQHSDLLVFDFLENYQNLTLKTALMMQWTLDRCPNAEFLYKTDDDMVINPWILKEVLKENPDAKLLGYSVNNSYLHREEYSKWFLPRWLCAEDQIPGYLTGPGYLISGDYIKTILKTAFEIPLINIEDVYFTYLVAKKSLGYQLTHDSRLSAFRPWPSWNPISCAYWVQASVHSLIPREILSVWSRIAVLGKEYEKNVQVCRFYRRYVSHFMYTY